MSSSENSALTGSPATSIAARWGSLIAFILIVGVAAALGGLFPPDAWFAGLNKPSFNPPNWVFAPVWTTLYVMIACAGWLIWQARSRRGAGLALALFGAQLVLNAVWTPLFFGAHAIGAALADIGLLWLVLLTTVVACWRVRPLAGGLLLPYLAWVSFAAALNFAFWRLNA